MFLFGLLVVSREKFIFWVERQSHWNLTNSHLLTRPTTEIPKKNSDFVEGVWKMKPSWNSWKTTHSVPLSVPQVFLKCSAGVPRAPLDLRTLLSENPSKKA